jgi:hypothetical protein
MGYSSEMRRMCPRLLKPVALLMLVVFTVSLSASLPARVRAQSTDDDVEADLGPEAGDDEFVEGADGLTPLGAGEEDFSEGNQYVDESTTGPGGVNLGLRQAQIRIRQEREQFPLNAAWGGATGLLLGGWFALLNSGDNRTTLQSIGTGVVLGVILGIAVGARTVINPDAPTPVAPGTGANTPSGQTSTQPLVSLNEHGYKFGVQFNF